MRGTAQAWLWQSADQLWQQKGSAIPATEPRMDCGIFMVRYFFLPRWNVASQEYSCPAALP
jgi:hypothetical protein